MPGPTPMSVCCSSLCTPYWLLHPPCMSWVGEPHLAPMTPFAFLQHMCPKRACPRLSPPNPAWGLREPLLYLAVLPGQGESSFGVSFDSLGPPLGCNSEPQALEHNLDLQIKLRGVQKPTGHTAKSDVLAGYCCITNYLKLSGLKQYLFILISLGQESGHSLAGSSVRGLLGCSQHVSQLYPFWISGSSSKLTWLLAEFSSFVAEGLRYLFSCFGKWE